MEIILIRCLYVVNTPPMGISWADLAKRIDIPLDEIKRLIRDDPDAPQTRSIHKWNTYLESKSEIRSSLFPGLNPYDEAVRLKKTTYAEALQREKVAEQLVINDTRRIALDKERGKVIEFSVADAMLKDQREALLQSLSILPGLASADAIPADRPKVKKNAKRWIAQVQAEVDKRLKALQR